MAAPSLALLDRTLPSHHHHAAAFGGSDRLSKEIFSILESNFLFGAQPEGGACSAGRVRVLSIDGASDGGALAAAALVRLERRLQELSGNPAARVADFFDVAAGSGAGGFLAAALFACRMPAEAARDVVAKNRKVFSGRHGRGGLFRRPEAVFKKVFGDLTVRDAAKPLLIPCYDMATAAPFVFSRADAVEAEAFDFPLWQVCAAACGVGPAEVACLDGRTRLRAAAATGGGGAVANPTAVAVTHVLHNKREFPFAAGAGDLVVLSLGGDAAASAGHASSSSLLRIAGACQADMVRGPSRINGVRREQSNQLHPYPGQRHCSRSDGGGGHDGAGRGVRPVPGKEADAADQRRAAGRRGRAACAGAAPEAGEQDARGVHQAVGDAKDLLLVGVHAHHGVHQLLLGVALRLDRHDDAIN